MLKLIQNSCPRSKMFSLGIYSDRLADLKEIKNNEVNPAHF